MRALKIAGAAIAAVVVIIALLLVIGIPSGFLTAQIQERGAMTTTTAPMTAPAIFSALISTFQTAANGTYFGHAVRGRNRSGELIPESGGAQ
jgi:hypothetical protein